MTPRPSSAPYRPGGLLPPESPSRTAGARTAADYELVDLADYPLPHLDEAIPPSMGQYQGEHAKAWAAKIAEFDRYIFVTPEYNHSTSGVRKNAIDYLCAE